MQVDNLKSSGPLACILHGDFWINNMLFKYADQAYHSEKEDAANQVPAKIPVSLRMLDFQLSRLGHPLSDILYFMYSSTVPETRERHMLVLLRYYFDTLTTDLRLLGVSLDNYSWQDFLEDYKKRSLMWMFIGVMIVSMTLNKKVVTSLQDMDAEEQLKEPKPGEILFPFSCWFHGCLMIYVAVVPLSRCRDGRGTDQGRKRHEPRNGGNVQEHDGHVRTE